MITFNIYEGMLLYVRYYVDKTDELKERRLKQQQQQLIFA